MVESIFWGTVLRFLQAALQSSPFIFSGLCVSALFYRMLGPQKTRWLFGSNTASSLFQSWLIGMLLPGCSLGTIPIVRQLRNSGIAVGTIFAFALSSPLFDPLSLLYGLTLPSPFTILAFATLSLVVVTVSGWLFDRWYPDTEVHLPPPPLAPFGAKRLLAVWVAMARESISSTAIYILIGLLGSAFFSSLIPHGALQRSMTHGTTTAPLLMTAVAIPFYTTPMATIGILGSMFQHGNSIGAAFSLLLLGAGVNLGLIAWMGVNYGWRKCLIWMSLMVAIILGISYGVERPLYPKDVRPADHTHAFDSFCRPFPEGATPAQGYASEVLRRVRTETEVHEWAGTLAIAIMVLSGLLLRWLDRRWRIEVWLQTFPVGVSRKLIRDWTIPDPVLVVLGAIAIFGFSVVGCYAYYPNRKEAIEELVQSNVEVFSAANSGDVPHALHWLPISEAWNRRMIVGVYLREWSVSDELRKRSERFSEHLDALKHLLEDDDDPSEIRAKVFETSESFRQLSSMMQ